MHIDAGTRSLENALKSLENALKSLKNALKSLKNAFDDSNSTVPKSLTGDDPPFSDRVDPAFLCKF